MNLHLDPANVATEKFSDPEVTAKGEKRAKVPMSGLTTLWFNTGTLCNLACKNCYIESTPKNDRLVYISHPEVMDYLDDGFEMNSQDMLDWTDDLGDEIYLEFGIDEIEFLDI